MIRNQIQATSLSSTHQPIHGWLIFQSCRLNTFKQSSGRLFLEGISPMLSPPTIPIMYYRHMRLATPLPSHHQVG